MSSNFIKRLAIIFGHQSNVCHSKFYKGCLQHDVRSSVRMFCTTTVWFQNANKTSKALVSVNPFHNEYRKTKESFLEIVDIFKAQEMKTGHVEFIYMALKQMEEYGVHEELEVYKKLIDVMPKGRMVPENTIQAEFMYFPKHQHCITDLLMKMEENGVMPDRSMQELLLSIFGDRAIPLRRYWRMMYWMPKFRNLSPWPLPRPVPKDPLTLAKMAISRICSVDLESKITLYKTKDDDESNEDTWIVSGQSPNQKTLLEYHPEGVPVYIEGGFKQYLRKSTITYFVLRADFQPNRRRRTPKDADDIRNLKVPFFDPPDKDDMIPKFSVHEQKDGIIYAVVATGTSSKNSIASWLRLLEKDGNPNLGKIPIIFRDHSPLGHVFPIESGDESNNKDVKFIKK